MFEIVHLTSVHSRFDTRIFHKECCSLLVAGYNVSLVVADGNGDETKNGVHIYDVGLVQGRVKRILETTNRVFVKAVELNADIYHLHDPELIPIGLKLRKIGKTVVFDAHEDLPNQILSKHYLNPLVKKILSIAVKIYEKWACAKLDGIVAATPYIRDKFIKINNNSIDVNNYPKLQEFAFIPQNTAKNNQVCYIGGLADVRGVVEMVDAIKLTNNVCSLTIAGDFADKTLESNVRQMHGWNRINFLGYVGREEVKDVLGASIAGLVVLHPTRSYVDALPVKMFEYMCAGIPVIASNFPLWRSIIEDAQCGICVDPLNPKAIAEAIDFFIENKDLAQKMGRNGIDAVNQKYNWSIEEIKLLNLYEKLLGI